MRRKLTRRQFLKAAGAAGLAALPLSALAGYGVIRAVEGDPPPNLSPFAALPEAWRDPASPITLLLPDQTQNPFGLYLAEILCAEGLNCFRGGRWEELGDEALTEARIVVLAEGVLTPVQAEALRDYVARGGRLIAMRPEAQLQDLFRVEAAEGETADAYLQVDAEHPLAHGIATERLQFHGAASYYRVAGAEVIAWLADKTSRTEWPAITRAHFGEGQAVLWAFDLARSVALTRQGNPAWANQLRVSRDGGIRAQDMFAGWIDLDRITLPQADEQMRLFSHLIAELLGDQLPLPRLWYFPAAAEGVLIATGDSHQNNWGAIETVLQQVEQRGGHMSVYYAPQLASQWRRALRRARDWADDLPLVGDRLDQPGNFPTPEHVARWLLRGHEFSLHPYVEAGLAEGWAQYWREFTGLGFRPASHTVRTHRILWTGWVESARMQATYGVRMNVDYYQFGDAFRKPDGDWVFGAFTGSGLPMRFVDEAGQVLNVFQQVTQLVDEQMLDMPWGERRVKISPEAAVEVSRTLIDHSLAGGHSAIGAQFHIDPYVFGGPVMENASRWLAGTLDHAVERGLPIWSAQEWLEFTELRHAARLTDIGWGAAAQRLEFRLEAGDDPEITLTVLIPLRFGERPLAQVQVDAHNLPLVERVLAGRSYAEIQVAAGAHRLTAVYA